jgi:hypothetical protein
MEDCMTAPCICTNKVLSQVTATQKKTAIFSTTTCHHLAKVNGSGYVPSGNIFNCQFWQPDIGLSGLTARKTCLRGEKNLPMMILSFRGQTLTNIIPRGKESLDVGKGWKRNLHTPRQACRDLATRSTQPKKLTPRSRETTLLPLLTGHRRSNSSRRSREASARKTPALQLLRCTAAA